MNSKFVLSLLLILPLSVWAGKEPAGKVATSALEYQQITNTRIEVDETHLRFFTNNAERLTIDNSGNLGIGTITPSYMLDMEGASTPRIEIHDLTNNIKLDLGADDNRTFIMAPGSHRIDLMTNSTERMTISSGGNIGIGTTSPTQLLSIEDGQIFMGMSSTENFESGRIRFAERPANYQGGYIHYDGDANVFNIGVHANNNATTSEDKDAISIMRNSGRVGIGTTSPSNSTLHIYRNATTGGFGSMTTSNAGLRVEDATQSLYIDGNSLFTTGAMNLGTTSNNEVFIGTNDTKRITIEGGGDVGIGTTNPTYKLEVNGDAYADTFYTDANTYADFVFDADYDLPTLKEVEDYIEKNHHLPEIPSEAEAKANGINLQEMQAKLLQKIEELTLYIIEQEKRIKQLEAKARQ